MNKFIKYQGCSFSLCAQNENKERLLSVCVYVCVCM